MVSAQKTLRAETKKDLEQMAREWVRDRREDGMEHIRWGWDSSKAEKTGAGMWRITLSAQTSLEPRRPPWHF